MSSFETGTKSSGWKVQGRFRTGGAHAGAIEWRYCKPKSSTWLGGGTTIPGPVENEVASAKDKIRAHFAKKFPNIKRSQGRAMKKAKAMKGTTAKSMKAPKSAAMKSAAMKAMKVKKATKAKK